MESKVLTNKKASDPRKPNPRLAEGICRKLHERCGLKVDWQFVVNRHVFCAKFPAFGKMHDLKVSVFGSILVYPDRLIYQLVKQHLIDQVKSIRWNGDGIV